MLVSKAACRAGSRNLYFSSSHDDAIVLMMLNATGMFGTGSIFRMGVSIPSLLPNIKHSRGYELA